MEVHENDDDQAGRLTENEAKRYLLRRIAMGDYFCRQESTGHYAYCFNMEAAQARQFVKALPFKCYVASNRYREEQIVLKWWHVPNDAATDPYEWKVK